MVGISLRVGLLSALLAMMPLRPMHGGVTAPVDTSHVVWTSSSALPAVMTRLGHRVGITSVMEFLGEPTDGIQPWLTLIAAARSSIDVNAYVLTSSRFATALRAAAQRGVRVRVVLDRYPYRDPSAPKTTRALLEGSLVHLRMAPARFEGAYRYDHAKYIVVDPGHPDSMAIVGSPNPTASAFDGSNAEDALETNDRAVTDALAQVFNADWTGHRAGAPPRLSLVLSPGSTAALLHVIEEPGPIAVTLEELGDAPQLYRALEAHTFQARVLVPAQLSPSERRYLQQLVSAGVIVRELHWPYLHGKLIIGGSATFIGSQNFSEVSLADNREVGIVSNSSQIRTTARAWFDGLWTRALPFNGAQVTTSSSTMPVPTTTTSLPVTVTTAPTPVVAPSSPAVTTPVITQTSTTYPYIPYGSSAVEVRSLWGPPTSISSATYDGYPEVIWSYAGARVYFQGGYVSYVSRS